MKAILLAGGFGTRLLPLTQNTPKALLPVGGKPIIDHVLAKILPLKPTRIYVLTNQKFSQQFATWADRVPGNADIRIVVERSRHEHEKLGSIGALGQIIEREGLSDDLLIIAADNLFDCSLELLNASFQQRGQPTIGLYDVKEKEKAKRFGVVLLDRYSRITDFLEKPENPPSTLVSTGIYFFPKRILPLVLIYLKEGRNPDAFGNFISWLSITNEVVGTKLPSGSVWYDIGSPEAYEAAKQAWVKH